MATSRSAFVLAGLLAFQQLGQGVLALNNMDSFPLPPRQSATQQAVYTHHAALAKEASGAATSQVLEFFDRADLRAGLEECCTEIAKLPAEEILKRFRAEVLAAELAHSFPQTNRSGHGYDETLAMMEEYPIFMNLWQATLVDEAEGLPVQFDSGMNVVEENLYGCAAFANTTKPTWDEAAGRMIYTAHNLWSPEVLGTMAAFDHMILANWAVLGERHSLTMVQEALKFFSHSPFASSNYSSLPSLNDEWIGDYWEAVLLGAPSLTDVKFVLPMFMDLFGTSDGEHLARLAKQHTWPVIWAFGELSTSDLPGQVRLLDPRSAAYAKLNITIPDGATEAFDALWSKVASARQLKGQLSDDEALQYWDELKAQQIWVAPAAAHLCAATDSCVGVAMKSENACICSDTAGSAVSIMV